MNMFLHELKAYRKSTIIWAVSLVLLVVFFLSIFPGFTKDADEFKKVLEGYPLGVRKALGITLDTISSLLGFYSYIFGYIILCGSIQAMNLGISILSKEVREKTADFLLTKPVTRTQIVTAKLLAALTSLLITNMIYMAAAGMMAAAVSEKSFDMSVFIMISLTGLFIELIFMALGVLVSVIFSKIKSVVTLSLSIVFAFFIIGMFDSVLGEKAIRYITPFKYYDSTYIIKHSSYEAPFMLLEAAFILIAITLSYVIYLKKDIHAV
jgi:ABC-2 type transport system permease protein